MRPTIGSAGPAAVTRPAGAAPSVAASNGESPAGGVTTATRRGAAGSAARDASAGSASDGPGGKGPGGNGPGGNGPDAVAPAAKIPGRDPIWARLLVVFGVLLVLASTGLIVATKVLANRYDNAVNKGVLIDTSARRDTTTAGGHLSITGPLNYLLLGSDSRDDSPEAGQRSDTIIILHIPRTLDRAYLISIPRDLRVEIPADPSINFTGSTEKINGAFEYGKTTEAGARLVSSALKDLTGISFDGAAIINFDGFRRAVELLGGVDMCVDEHTESQHIGYDKNGNFLAPWTGADGEIRVSGSTPKTYEVGCRHFLPWEALDYVRQRKSLPDGDYGRQRHQQQFLRAVLEQATRQNFAQNPFLLDKLIQAVGSSLTVDTNGVPLTELAYGLRGVTPSTLVGIKLPSEARYLGGISYVLPIEQTADGLYQALQSDRLDEWTASHAEWVNTL